MHSCLKMPDLEDLEVPIMVITTSEGKMATECQGEMMLMKILQMIRIQMMMMMIMTGMMMTLQMVINTGGQGVGLANNLILK